MFGFDFYFLIGLKEMVAMQLRKGGKLGRE